MKKILLLFSILILFAGNVYTKVITTFLGIPIDGTKIEMKRKLVAKGFRYVKGEDFLRGEFNGTEVNLYVVTNKNKVWRIMVINEEPIADISQVRIRYNLLIKQFSNSNKYYPFDDEKDYTIPINEDISKKIDLDPAHYMVNYHQLTKIKSETPTEDLLNRRVWININKVEDLELYVMPIYFDNLYNMAHGEDL